MMSEMSKIDFDATLARLLELTGSAVTIAVAPADLAPPGVISFGGILRAGTALDLDTQADEDEGLVFNIEQADGSQIGVLFLHRLHFHEAEIAGEELRVSLGSIVATVTPDED